MSYTVFPFPTLANPERLHDVESLRTELHHANRELIWSRAALAQLNGVPAALVGNPDGRMH